MRRKIEPKIESVAHKELKELLICPICNKEFESDDDTKYIIAGGYTCSWKCFLDEVKRREMKKKQKQEERER